MKRIITTLTALILILTITACSADVLQTVSVVSSGQSEGVSTKSTMLSTGAETVAQTLSENSQVHAEAAELLNRTDTKFVAPTAIKCAAANTLIRTCLFWKSSTRPIKIA